VTLEAAGDADAAIAALAGFCSAPPELDGLVLRVPVAERKGTIAAAVQRLNDAGVGIDDISMRRPTLDDVFLKLTGHAAEDEEEGEG
jgi:ABC-2 type transport system ATP-binding protein